MPTRKLSPDAAPEHVPTARAFTPADKAALLRRLGRTRSYVRRAEFEAALDRIAEAADAFDWNVPTPAACAAALRAVAPKARALRGALRAVAPKARALRHALNKLPPFLQGDLDFRLRFDGATRVPDAEGVPELRHRLERLLETIEGMTARQRPRRADPLRAHTGHLLWRVWNTHAVHPERGRRAFIADGLRALGSMSVDPKYHRQFDEMLGPLPEQAAKP